MTIPFKVFVEYIFSSFHTDMRETSDFRANMKWVEDVPGESCSVLILSKVLTMQIGEPRSYNPRRISDKVLI